MDIISRHAPHNYYLRSLERSEQQVSLPPFSLAQRPAASSGAEFIPACPGARGLVAPPVYKCPYNLPTLSLPAPPPPKGSSANDYYEALEARDQEIRKGGKYEINE